MARWPFHWKSTSLNKKNYVTWTSFSQIIYPLFGTSIFLSLTTLPLTFRLSTQPTGQRTSSCCLAGRFCFSYPECEKGNSAAQGSQMLPENLPLAWPIRKKTACSIFTMPYWRRGHITQLSDTGYSLSFEESTSNIRGYLHLMLRCTVRLSPLYIGEARI